MATRDGFDPQAFNLVFEVEPRTVATDLRVAKDLAALMTGIGARKTLDRTGQVLNITLGAKRPWHEPHVLGHDFSPR